MTTSNNKICPSYAVKISSKKICHDFIRAYVRELVFMKQR